jgi:acyl-CoA reductase-like NAD-dependent aldehyde dehydrogenase
VSVISVISPANEAVIRELPQAGVATPFGGFKQRVIGRELGLAGMEANTELETAFYSTAAA